MDLKEKHHLWRTETSILIRTEHPALQAGGMGIQQQFQSLPAALCFFLLWVKHRQLRAGRASCLAVSTAWSREAPATRGETRERRDQRRSDAPLRCGTVPVVGCHSEDPSI